jgi:hypothetical protein
MSQRQNVKDHTGSGRLAFRNADAKITRNEPEFVNLLRSPGIESQYYNPI